MGEQLSFPPESGRELAWTRAALAATVARLADLMGAAAAMQAVTVEALESIHADEFGLYQDLDLPRLVRACEAVRTADQQIQELIDALDDVDETVCAACGQALWIPMGTDQLQHCRTRESGGGKESYTPEDPHAPREQRRARIRPAIIDGRAAAHRAEGTGPR